MSNFYGYEGPYNGLEVEVQRLNRKKSHGVVPKRKIDTRRKGKYGFITGEVQMPTIADPNYKVLDQSIRCSLSGLLFYSLEIDMSPLHLCLI